LRAESGGDEATIGGDVRPWGCDVPGRVASVVGTWRDGAVPKGVAVNVLIVDDSQLVAERLEGMLTQISEDLRVIWHAQSAAEGRQAFRCGKPDVIILDVQMPGGNGIDLLPEVKGETPAPVVIVLTNYPFPQYRDRCLEAGADYFFDKSGQFEEVSTVLAGLLRSNGKGNGSKTS
jgi:DNA-binding NarL/FixJ family response regulator